jgi:branched-chain amino acid transport system permease protein
MFQQTPLKLATLALIILGLLLYAILGGYFARELVIEVAVLAILAMSLDMVAGYGGMVSLCHGAIFGLGAYMYAIVNVLGEGSPISGALAALAVSGLFGLLVGAITSRTHGIYFIMTTLAFGQMAYVLIFDASSLGGDDGMWGLGRGDLSGLGINLEDSLQFAILCLLCVPLSYAVLSGVLRSGFGRSLVGIRENEGRMRALGITIWKIKAIGFALSGTVAGLAGVLAAQHTMFVSPELMTWTVSGEVLVVVILGGLGTLIGPAVGAVLLIFLKHALSSFTDYWHIVIGVLLILVVMSGGRGVYGGLELFWERRRNSLNKQEV